MIWSWLRRGVLQRDCLDKPCDMLKVDGSMPGHDKVLEVLQIKSSSVREMAASRDQPLLKALQAGSTAPRALKIELNHRFA